MSAHLQMVIDELHCNTWHTIQGVPDITQDHFGSKPGDPLGSIVFNYLEAAVLGKCEERARECGVIPKMPVPTRGFPADHCEEEVEALDATYADDNTFFGPMADAASTIRNAEPAGGGGGTDVH